ncbi:MAG: hypothetical protein Q8L20_13105 [Gammaproteobacteria bacterium]|nr:hypothetical protein [Gammaproteobacteria bacterium]MDP2347973.1 hypothetical protein [Gammaproteobacteria bacterium]
MSTGVVWIAICGIIGWVITVWIQARHGYPIEGSLGQKIYPGGKDTKTTKQLLESELAARDQTIANLKERVEILERIVTDSSGHLGQEIERLRA